MPGLSAPAAGGLATLAFCSALLVWRWLAGWAGCWLWLLPVVAWVALTRSFSRLALQRRACLLGCLFEAHSPWPHRLRGRIWLPLRSAGAGLVVSLALTLESLIWPLWWFGSLAAGLLVLVALREWLRRRIAGLRPPWRDLAVTALAVRLWVAPMVVVLALLQLFSPPPLILHPGLVETLAQARASAGAACPVLDVILSLWVEGSAVGWWTMAQAGEELHDLGLRVLLWGGFLLSGGLAFVAAGRLTLMLADGLGGRRDEA